MGILVGIPLFFNAGFIVVVPLVFTIACATGLPKLYIGMPMIGALSVTHGFLPPHPGPVALDTIFKEYFGLTVTETFKTWTLMESSISVLGLEGVLILNYFK